MAEGNGTGTAEAAKASAPIVPKKRLWGTPNPTESIKIQLDRERELRVDGRAMLLFQRQYSKDLRNFDTWNEMDGNWEMLMNLLHLALHRDDPDLSFDDMLELDGVTLANAGYIAEKLWDTLGISVPNPEETEEAVGDSPNPQDPSTGSTSGPSDGSTSDSPTMISGDSLPESFGNSSTES